MQSVTILNFKGFNKVFSFVKNNKFTIILSTFFIIGLILSSAKIGSGLASASFFEKYINSFIFSKEGQSFFSLFINCFFKFMLYIAFAFILGSSMLGVALVPFVVLFSGFTYGNIAAKLYSVYSLLGVSYYTVIILPAAVIFVITLIFSCKESIIFSLKLVKLSFPSVQPTNLYSQFRYFCYRFLLFTVYVILASILDALISSNLLDSFSLK